jgi:uncharacterized protein (DUF1778 family)
MKTKKFFTKKAQVPRSFRVTATDIDLLHCAAMREEISQSEFVRQAIRERAKRVLAPASGEEQRLN